MSPELSNLDRRDRGMTPEYQGAADLRGYTALFRGLITVGALFLAGTVLIVGIVAGAVALGFAIAHLVGVL